MFQLLLIAILFAVIFWVVRGYGRSRAEDQPREMVCDALSGVYFPKNEAVSITRHGETLYFINQENRDKYLTSNR